VSKAYEDYLQKNGRYLPVLIKIINDHAYIIQDLSGQGIPEGAELLMINGQAMAEIISSLLANLTADGYNLSKKYYIMNNWFNGIYHYFIDDSTQFTLVYRQAEDGPIVTKTVAGIKNQQMQMTTMSIYFLRRNDQYVKAFTEDYALLSIKSFSLNDKKKYRAFIDEFFQEIAAKEISHLILDLRDNWGGNPYYASYLLSYLISSPTTYFGKAPFYYAKYKKPQQPAEHRFKGRLYILINGASFSTTGHLCSLLKSHGIGVFIGEETGGSYVCTDASINVTLRRTKLRLHCATTVFTTAVSNLPLGKGVMPDYPITPTFQDYLAGTDPQMELAILLISSFSSSK
jgi:C-terminal processing protease CtpA/Prc